MGISWIHRSELYHHRKMRFLVVAVALSGAAYAQVDVVDPRLTAPYAYGLDTFGGKSAPCVNGANLPVPCAGAPLAYAGYPYAPVAYGKRSADAEPEADADADALYGYYGYPYGYRAYGYGYGYPYGLGAYGYGAFGYAGYPYGLTYGAGIAATNNVLGHAVAYTAGGVTHSSNVGVCTNYLGAQVPC